MNSIWFFYVWKLDSEAILVIFGYFLLLENRDSSSTLTTTISTDSIYALAIGAATVSTLFHDYGAPLPT